MKVNVTFHNQNTEFTAEFDGGRRFDMTLMEFLAIAGALEQYKRNMEGDFSGKSSLDNVDGLTVVRDNRMKCQKWWAFWFGFFNAFRKTTNDELIEYVNNKCKESK